MKKYIIQLLKSDAKTLMALEALCEDVDFDTQSVFCSLFWDGLITEISFRVQPRDQKPPFYENQLVLIDIGAALDLTNESVIMSKIDLNRIEDHV